MLNATNLSRAATVSAASSSQRQIPLRRGSFTADRSDTKSFSSYSFDNKRQSRDDLALILKSSKKGNVTAFHIPIYGRPPSPDLSPRTSSLSRTTLVRTSTPDSIGDAAETGVIAVGMAIGSPTHMGDLVPAPWNPQNRAMNAAVDAPEPTPEPESKPTQEPIEDNEQKPRKWGIFRSKSKRTRPEKPQRSLTDSNASTTSLASSALPSTISGEPSSRRTPKHKPIVLRSQTDPIVHEPVEITEESPLSVQTPSEVTISPSKIGKEKVTTPGKAPKETKPKESASGGMGRKMSLRAFRGDSSKKRAQRAAIPPSSPPPMPAIPRTLLDVEIPNIKMDRYSVMFNSVLQPPQQGSASSLLARRQANLDHLKMVKNAIAENRDETLRPRRATSPQPSPIFVPTGDDSKPLPSPRYRANTSPAPYDSPSFVQTPEILTHEAKAKVVTLSRSASQHSKFASQATHYQPVLVSKFNRRPSGTTTERISLVPKIHPSPPRAVISPEKLSRSNSPFTSGSRGGPVSPEHTDDEKDIRVAKGRSPSPTQASWQMASPPASVTSSTAETSKHFSPSSSLASPKKGSDSDAQEALRNAVEISIARQISVSHQQRKMLHPLKSNPSIRHRRNGSPATSGPSYIPIEEDERLSETKSSTPVLVNPRELTYSPDAYQMHRKSEMVVLEES